MEVQVNTLTPKLEEKNSKNDSEMITGAILQNGETGYTYLNKLFCAMDNFQYHIAASIGIYRTGSMGQYVYIADQ